MAARTDKQERARADILAAAARAISERGFHGMSMRELARATGRSLAGFYTYFDSKEEVLFALQERAFQTLIATVEEALVRAPDPVARLYVFALNHVQYVAAHPDVMRVLVTEAAALPPEHRACVRELKEAYFRIARDIIRAITRDGCGEDASHALGDLSETELERVTYSVFGMLNWTYGWYDAGRHGSPREVARTIHRTALCGLVAGCPHNPVQDAMDDSLAALDVPSLISSAHHREASAS